MTKCRKKEEKYQNVEKFGFSENVCELKLFSEETDLCKDEIRDFIIEIMEDEYRRRSSDPNLLDTRKNHILESILRCNTKNGEKDKLKRSLKEILNSCSSFDPKTVRKLKNLGFEVSESGSHFRLVYKNDLRYKFIVSRTPSDRRAYLNSYQTAAIKIF